MIELRLVCRYCGAEVRGRVFADTECIMIRGKCGKCRTTEEMSGRVPLTALRTEAKVIVMGPSEPPRRK